MSFDQIDVAIEVIVADADAHASKRFATAAESDAADQSFLAEGTIVIIHEQHAGRGIAGYEDVLPAVFVDVERHNREPVGTSKRGHAGFFGNIRERSVSIVAVKRVRRETQTTRATVRGNAFKVAVRYFERRLGGGGQIDLNIVGNEQIEQAVRL